MAILIDSVGTQHYANKMVLAENRKVGVKSLPSALADVDNLIEEMKGQFEAEYGSALDMKLENSSGVFSVGAGSGLDKREEVENSFTDIEIKGRTLQNLCIDTTLPTTDIVDLGGGIYSIPPINYRGIRISSNLLKPSTEYTVILEILENPTGGYIESWTTLDECAFEGVWRTGNGEQGTFIRKAKTKADLSLSKYAIRNFVAGVSNTSKNVKLRYSILEGDYTNTPLSELPYVEGIQGVGEEVENGYEVGVKSCGKNLLDSGLWKSRELIDGIETLVGDGYINFEGNIRGNPIMLPIEIKKGKTYSISQKSKSTKYSNYFKFANTITKKQSNYLLQGKSNAWVENSRVFIADEDYDIIFMDTGEAGQKGYIQYIQVEESSTPTPYEPYVEDTLTYTLEEQLHRLPNGVCDEIMDGKLIRRVGKVVLDGSENINKQGTDWDGTKVVSFNLYLPDSNLYWYAVHPEGYSKNGHFISNRFISRYAAEYAQGNKNNLEGIGQDGNSASNARVVFCINRNRLSSDTVDSFKQWLSENPTTVLYELAEPIITDLETPSLQCWKNGTISIDSTVPPTTTHTVALNKPAQIKRNIEELTTLREKVKTLEGQYDQIALEQAHKLELLNHSFELDYNI